MNDHYWRISDYRKSHHCECTAEFFKFRGVGKGYRITLSKFWGKLWEESRGRNLWPYKNCFIGNHDKLPMIQVEYFVSFSSISFFFFFHLFVISNFPAPNLRRKPKFKIGQYESLRVELGFLQMCIRKFISNRRHIRETRDIHKF